MRMQWALAGFGFLALAAGCAPMPKVALQATPADLEILAGEWRGEYESAVLGRRGTLEFKLKAGTYEAYGDVLMAPRGGLAPYQSRPPYEEEQNPSDLALTQLLTIKFIRASHGTITGRLDRYWDPDRSCFANTAFNGNLGDTKVEGTFKTTYECGVAEATGTWKANKKAAKPNALWR